MSRDRQTDTAPRTRTEWVEARLRDEILDAVLAPGEPLVTTTLAARLGVSATPVREALRRLESEGLVELVSHGSARVAPVSVAEAAEIYELRCLVEPRAVERAVRVGGADYVAGVEHAFAALVAAGPTVTHRLHADFHRSLFAACDSTWMRREAVRLMEHGQRFVAAVVGAGMLAGADRADAHRPLRDRVIAGDADGAAMALTSHLEVSLTLIRSLNGLDAPSREESA